MARRPKCLQKFKAQRVNLEELAQTLSSAWNVQEAASVHVQDGVTEPLAASLQRW